MSIGGRDVRLDVFFCVKERIAEEVALPTTDGRQNGSKRTDRQTRRIEGRRSGHNNLTHSLQGTSHSESE